MTTSLNPLKDTLDIRLRTDALEILEKFANNPSEPDEFYGDENNLLKAILEKPDAIIEKMEGFYDYVLRNRCKTEVQISRLNEKRENQMGRIERNNLSIVDVINADNHFWHWFKRLAFSRQLNEEWKEAFKEEGEKLRIIQKRILEPYLMLKQSKIMSARALKNISKLIVPLGDDFKDLNQVLDDYEKEVV